LVVTLSERNCRQKSRQKKKRPKKLQRRRWADQAQKKEGKSKKREPINKRVKKPTKAHFTGEGQKRKDKKKKKISEMRDQKTKATALENTRLAGKELW